MKTISKREAVRLAVQGKRPPYVPWHLEFTMEAHEKLAAYFGQEHVQDALQNHLLRLGHMPEFFADIGGGRMRDYFGVVWDRSVDKDIGQPSQDVLPEPTLEGYEFPDPLEPRFFADIPAQIEKLGDRFRVFDIGFSLYERAWTMRGMANLMMDFHDHPEFVDELLNAIADYNIAQVREATRYDIDAVYFGDDWGQQLGLQMSPVHWRRFIKPVLKRMYGAVREAGKFVFIHSCGKVEELFDELVEIGVNCFNPFQPEVMDVFGLMERYRGRLAFFGGLSTQRTLPYGSAEEVQEETRCLLKMGSDGGYLFAPAHGVEGDVPLANMLAFIETVRAQPGWQN